MTTPPPVLSLTTANVSVAMDVGGVADDGNQNAPLPAQLFAEARSESTEGAEHQPTDTPTPAPGNP